MEAVFFDMDSTAIGQETIVELAACAGKQAEVHRITEQAMAGEIDFEEALRARVQSLAGLPVSSFAEVQRRLVINSGLHQFSTMARAKGIRCYLISGGFTSFAAPIAEELGFTACHANHLEIRNGILTGGLTGAIVDAEAKREFLLEQAKAEGFSLDACVAVGDGANDLAMMEAAAVAIGYHPKDQLIEHLDGAIYDDHHTLINLIQD